MNVVRHAVYDEDTTAFLCDQTNYINMQFRSLVVFDQRKPALRADTDVIEKV